MEFNQMANQDFEHAFLRAFWRKILTRLKGESNNLLPFDEVRSRMPVRGQHSLGLQQVAIDKIVGSMGRYHDFDRAFLPTQTRTRGRWISIDKAHYAQVSLPPVDLYKLGEIYFVKDGNHRVSVARERGQEFVDAYVTEIDIPVILTPDIRMDELQLKKEYAEFILKTGLNDSRPEADLETRVSGQYERLFEHISVHRWYLGEQRGSEVSMAEAAASWYDHVYLPLVKVIRELSIPSTFSGSSETDLYVWIMEYQGYLRQAYEGVIPDEQSARAQAAGELVQNYPLPSVKKLVNALARTNWLDELLIRQEYARFLEQTRLSEVRPQARLLVTVPGQYASLSEHIDVHRWYLGEQRGAEVPYVDAVASWFDHVYSPLVSVISEQGILEHFPGRTETDLYLWIIEHQGYLQETYGGQVPLEQAVEHFVADQAARSRKDDRLRPK